GRRVWGGGLRRRGDGCGRHLWGKNRCNRSFGGIPSAAGVAEEDPGGVHLGKIGLTVWTTAGETRFDPRFTLPAYIQGMNHNERSIRSHVDAWAESLASGIADVGRDRFGHCEPDAECQGSSGREPNAGRV